MLPGGWVWATPLAVCVESIQGYFGGWRKTGMLRDDYAFWFHSDTGRTALLPQPIRRRQYAPFAGHSVAHAGVCRH